MKGQWFCPLVCLFKQGPGFSLSLYLPKGPEQVLKLGISVDYGVCNGKSKDGSVCTAVINKRRGIYCKYHKSKESHKFTAMRTELKGGNIRTAFRDPFKSEGIYTVDPLADNKNVKNRRQPVKLLSVEGLKKALRKVTANKHSQEIRFLAEITGTTNIKESTMQKQQSISLDKRKSSSFNTNSSEVIRNQQLIAKRSKIEKEQTLADKTKQGTGKLMELDFVSSDEGF